jgi:hypothetical protein
VKRASCFPEAIVRDIHFISAALMTVLLSAVYLPGVVVADTATPDAVSGTTIPLPAGNYTALALLGSAVNGPQSNQSFVVTYSDGTTTTITQSLSDWWGPPQNFPGESLALTMPYLIAPSGYTRNEVVYVYGYRFTIDSAKTVKSLTLPRNRHVVVLAIDVSAGAAKSIPVNLAAVGNVVGVADNGTAPANGGWDSEGYAYSGSLLGTTISSAGSTFTLGGAGSTAPATAPAAAAISDLPGTASLTWLQPTQNTDGSPLTNLAGYVVRYGASGTGLNTVLYLGSTAMTSVEISNLSSGSWEFEVCAFNTNNIESQFSAIVSKTIQ